MREVGGYIELEQYFRPMLHDDAVKLNCGRNALAYVIQAKMIKKIYIPKFLCDSVRKVCERENVSVEYYSVGIDFFPENIEIENDSYLYIVNYYGQLNNRTLKKLVDKYRNVIVDNVQVS